MGPRNNQLFYQKVDCWIDGDDFVSSWSRHYEVGPDSGSPFGCYSVHDRGGVFPRITHLSYHKVDFGTNTRDDGF